MLTKILRIVLKAMLWIAIGVGILATLLFMWVSLRASGGQRIFDLSVTSFVGCLTAFLMYVAAKPSPTVGKVVRTRFLASPFLRFLIVMSLAVLAMAGFFLTPILAGSLGWVLSLIFFSVTVILPCLGIRVIFGPDRDQVDRQCEDGPPAMHHRQTVFWRSQNNMTYHIVTFSFCILFFPIPLGFSLLPLWQLDWGTVLLSLVGVILTSTTLWLLMVQYRQVRDRDRPLIMLDDAGLHFWRAREEIIPWQDLTSANLTYRKGIPILLLGLTHPERYIDRFNRWYSPELWIGLHILKDDERSVVKAIREHPRFEGDLA